MERASIWKQEVLTDELAQGMEKAMQLRLHLCSTSLCEAEDLLLRRIISSFEKALRFLKRRVHAGVAQVEAPSSAASASMMIPADGSSRSHDMKRDFTDYYNHGDASKKRKLQTTWTEYMKVNSEHGLEGPGDDGYSWRKYGQKDILGSKYPRFTLSLSLSLSLSLYMHPHSHNKAENKVRLLKEHRETFAREYSGKNVTHAHFCRSYYRCTYRLGRNCWATKQVQRSDEDPTIFEITYKGTHTCTQLKDKGPPPVSPKNQEMKCNTSCSDQLEENPILSNFKSNLRVNIGVSCIQELPAHFSFPSTFHENENHCSPISALADGNHLGAYSMLFDSPATSGSNYFSTGMYQMRDHGEVPMQHSETDIADVMLAHASTTNSLIGGMEFSIPTEIDPDFPFNIPGFFTC